MGAWGWVVVGSLVTLRLGVALGLILGAALDLAIRLAFMTVDLPWTNDPAATLVAGGLVVGALLGMRIAAPRARNTGEVDARLLGPVVGLGLWLALTLLVTANSAQVMARTEAGFGAVAGALAVGHAAAIRLAAGASARPLLRPGLTALACVGLLGFVGLWSGWPAALVWAGLAAASADLLLAACLAPSERPATQARATASAFAVSAGLAIFMAVVYVFYATQAQGLIAAGAVIGLGVAGGLGAAAGDSSTAHEPRFVVWPANAVVAVLLGVGTLRAVSWVDRQPLDAAPSRLTVMTFNIRAGFGTDSRWDLERVAQAIERENPDLVALQEVNRGWLVASGADQALWLSERLGMPFIFGPAAGDLHGNLLLSRSPLSGGSVPYAQSVSLGRALIDANLGSQRGPVSVLTTHLDAPATAVEARRAQAEQLAAAAGGRQPALVLGDFNAVGEADELSAIRGAGFREVSTDRGSTAPTFPSDSPGVRIDHIFVTRDIGVIETRTGVAGASDHLPVIARVQLPG